MEQPGGRGWRQGVRNVISGNTNGVQISNGSTGNVVSGNYIGTDATGRLARSNRVCGVQISSAWGNVIGGAAAGGGECDIGQRAGGGFCDRQPRVEQRGAGEFDWDGCDGVGGDTEQPRGDRDIGGAVERDWGECGVGERECGWDAGIYLYGTGAAWNVIEGNKLGTDATGNGGLGNTHEGIYMVYARSNTVGGADAGSGNIISANNTWGILLDTNSTWNVIQGNWIGTQSDGVSALGNAYHGVECASNNASHNVIMGNVIAYSKGAYCGVRVRDGSTNDAILGNAIFSNGLLGIDLGPAGTNANYHCGSSTGANLRQNHPVLTQAVTGNGTGVRGTMDSKAGTAIRLQFFANATCDSAGAGEGQIYLGDMSVVTGSGCTTNFVATLPASVPGGVCDHGDSDGRRQQHVGVFGVHGGGVGAAADLGGVDDGADRRLTLGWTNTATGFVLKQTGDLAPAGAMDGGDERGGIDKTASSGVTVSMTGTNRFYLLSFE